MFVVAAALLWLVVRGLIRLGRGGRRSLLWGLTGACFFGFAGLGWWARVLPEQRGMSFVMWHQLVRAGAALTATGFVIGFLALALPPLFNRFERMGFVSFLAIRHVRASKSGFLTVISILSMAGVAVSSFALCAVISIMGGFGADLKRKILGNNAHIKLETGTVGGFEGWKEVLALGIGASYLTAKAAARTVIFHGISHNDFKKYYLPVCRNLNMDNSVGKIVFFVTRIIQKSNFLKKRLFQIVVREQKSSESKRKMSSILWDTFTGSATYRNILVRFFHPTVIFSYLVNIFTSSLNPYKINNHEKQ